MKAKTTEIVTVFVAVNILMHQTVLNNIAGFKMPKGDETLETEEKFGKRDLKTSKNLK